MQVISSFLEVSQHKSTFHRCSSVIVIALCFLQLGIHMSIAQTGIGTTMPDTDAMLEIEC